MKPRIEIPRVLLERAAAMGRTLGDIQRDMRRLGVEVSLPTIRERLCDAGIRLVGQYDPWTAEKIQRRNATRKGERLYRQVKRRVGRAEGVPVRRAIFTPAEWARLRRWPDVEAAEQIARAILLTRAQQGDLEALAALRTRYRLRLPLVEQRLQPPMDANEREVGGAA